MFIDLTGSKAVIVELELDNALVKTLQSRNTKQNIHTEYNLELWNNRSQKRPSSPSSCPMSPSSTSCSKQDKHQNYQVLH